MRKRGVIFILLAIPAWMFFFNWENRLAHSSFGLDIIFPFYVRGIDLFGILFTIIGLSFLVFDFIKYIREQGLHDRISQKRSAPRMISTWSLLAATIIAFILFLYDWHLRPAPPAPGEVGWDFSEFGPTPDQEWLVIGEFGAAITGASFLIDFIAKRRSRA